MEKEIYSIKDLRKRLNISQIELAYKAGISFGHLNNIEKNIRPTTANIVKKLYPFFEGRGLPNCGSVNQLRASHLASFYDKDKQEEAYNLLYDIYMKQCDLEALNKE